MRPLVWGSWATLGCSWCRQYLQGSRHFKFLLWHCLPFCSWEASDTRVTFSACLLHPQVSAVPVHSDHRGFSFPLPTSLPTMDHWCFLLGSWSEGFLNSLGPASILGREYAFGLAGRASLNFCSSPTHPHGSKTVPYLCALLDRRVSPVPAPAGAGLCFVLVQDLGTRFSCPFCREDGFCFHPFPGNSASLPACFLVGR